MRKIVQIAFDTYGDSEDITSSDVVLCDDGSVWRWEVIKQYTPEHPKVVYGWVRSEKYDEIPQD